MKTQPTRLEKAIILSRLYTRTKLLDKYYANTEQFDLFSGYLRLDIDYIFKQALEEKEITDEHLLQAKDIISKHHEREIAIIDYYDERYPKNLRTVSDAPFLLYVKGNIETLKMNCLAVVGTRGASDYGRKMAFEYAKTFASEGICIVSGLALGIDTNAHRGAIAGKGYTVAILPSSPDTIYPEVNKPLADEILENKGAIISEYPLGTALFRGAYVQRNRIQSGMSKCSLIVESTPESGSARQAEWSHKQGRPIFVVEPDKFTSENSDFNLTGARHFIKQYQATAIKGLLGINEIRNLMK